MSAARRGATVLFERRSTPAELARLIAMSHATCETYRLPLWHAVAAGRMLVAAAEHPEETIPLAVLRRDGRPAVVLLAGEAHIGAPADWPQVPEFLRWARYAIVHGTGARREHYVIAAEMARFKRRVLMVECSSTDAPAWQACLKRARIPTLAILPPEGHVHPRAPLPEELR